MKKPLSKFQMTSIVLLWALICFIIFDTYFSFYWHSIGIYPCRKKFKKITFLFVFNSKTNKILNYSAKKLKFCLRFPILSLHLQPYSEYSDTNLT